MVKKLAKFWRKKPNQNVECIICPRNCIISPGNYGVCGARKNIDGELYTMVYGETTSANVDPIEKKPLYHFRPGSRVFSISTVGCNFECKHCQNWRLSQSNLEDVRTETIEPNGVIERTKKSSCDGIAYTYGEPVIWYEYCHDTARQAKDDELYNVFITNGYMNQEPWKKIGPYLDALNVDLKAFNDEFYENICNVPSVEPVLDTCKWAVENDIHLEITNLIIPDENDNPDQIREMCKWIFEELKPTVPLHFSRFRPMHKLTNKSSTPVSTLEKALEIAKGEGLEYVYVGNVPGHEGDNTYCPDCDKLLISRYGFSITEYNLENGKCPNCGRDVNIETSDK